MKTMNLIKIAVLSFICSITVCICAQQGSQGAGAQPASSAEQNGAQAPAQRQHPVSQFGKNNNEPADGRIAEPKTGTPAAADPSYVIGPSDVITVRVWHEPDLSAQGLPVRPDGKISMALLNDVQAAGMTPMQLGEKITASLKKYLSDPQVTVVIDAINSKRIYVVGQVARPGAYPLLPQMTVLQALSGAGGFPQYANPKKTYVLRGEKKLPFNYKEALKGKDLDQQIILQPGDTIVVP